MGMERGHTLNGCDFREGDYELMEDVDVDEEF